MRREGIRQERERSKTNSEAAETRRATLSEREGKSNSALQGDVVFRFCSWPHQL